MTSSQAAGKVKVGLVQMTSVNDKEANFRQNLETVRAAARQGCSLVCFPECFSFIGARPGEAQEAAEELSGPTVARYRELAKEHGVWLSLGGFQEKGPPEAEGGKIFNTHLVIDAAGEVAATYRKIHLFDVPMTGLVESKQSLPGEKLAACESPAGKLGLTVCYDVRFPELYQKLTFLHGAQLLLVPSAFAMKTGEDGNKRQSWGHSLAIDPWGRILVDMGVTVGLAVVEIDPQLVQSTRDNMPMHLHRRYDLYGDGPHAAAPDAAEKEAEEKKKDGLFFG